MVLFGIIFLVFLRLEFVEIWVYSFHHMRTCSVHYIFKYFPILSPPSLLLQGIQLQVYKLTGSYFK